jgi:hypothetical protein
MRDKHERPALTDADITEDNDDSLFYDDRPVKVVGFTRGQTERVEGHHLFTVSKLIRWLRAGNQLTMIDGIGSEKAGAMADKLADFRKGAHRGPR